MCDARQAKRLFAIFVSAGILGTQNLLILYAIALDVAVLYPVLWISISFIFVLFALGIHAGRARSSAVNGRSQRLIYHWC